MKSLSDYMNMPEAERRKLQKGPIRSMMIGAWSKREPQIMKAFRNAVSTESGFSNKLTAKILDRLFAILNIKTMVTTYEQTVNFIQSLPDDYIIAKGPCACRINTAEEMGPDARDMDGGKLDYDRRTPLNVDIQFAKCGEKFVLNAGYEKITKEELLELEKDCRNMGLVSNIYFIKGGEGSLCHCSSKTCVPLMVTGLIRDKGTSVMLKGDFIAKTSDVLCDLGKCKGECAVVCHFFARSISEENGSATLKVNANRCFGCGICAGVCPEKAIEMIARKPAPPSGSDV